MELAGEVSAYTWIYELGFKGEGQANNRIVLTKEHVWKNGKHILSRPGAPDDRDKDRLTQIALESVNENKGFRELAHFIGKYIDTAKHGLPVVLLTDLDRHLCEASLRSSWIGGRSEPPGFLLRVARREVGAWIIGNAAAFYAHVRVRGGAISGAPESLADPKAALLSLVANGPGATCRDMCPPARSSSPIGRECNLRLESLPRAECP